ncbi:hypothetical protein [Roseovarius indicus]|uniref:hypothetical protein n=1 Tax=Roseovarius indicus TaxID=540747 RepID=UPI0007DA05C0|nr:hypothetical protein [Roseovarius indicus]OAO08254.1 hypothetical protein A8B76_12560 [Roseovarius indicus]
MDQPFHGTFEPSLLPKGGLTKPTLYVELAYPDRLEKAWLTQLVVQDEGSMPVHPGDKVEVVATIASDAFRREVAQRGGTLTVKHGPDVVGSLVITPVG